MKKKIKKMVIILFIYALSITGGTYAFLYLNSNVSNIIGKGQCNLINYKAQEINVQDLFSTTDYLEGTKTTVTLSYNNECDIYTLANIYIHTNDSTTSPIESSKALKYKVFQGEEQISEGVVSNKGDKIVATVPLTVVPTDYDIYLWIDSDNSLGAFDNTTYSGYIYASSAQTSTLNGFLVRDLSYNTNNGIAYNQVSWDRTNGTVTTDGVDDYIDCGLENYDFGDSISFIARFKTNNTAKDNRIAGNWEGAGVGLYVNSSNKFVVDVYIEGGYKTVTSSSTLSTNTWYTIVGTYDGTKVSLYVNGVLEGSLSTSGSIKVSPVPFNLGANPAPSGHDNYGTATFDSALIYDRALSETEIKNTFSGEINSSQVDKADLLLYYNFEDNFRENLVTNGYLSTGDNTNFPAFTYGADEYGGYLSYTSSNRSKLEGTEYIPVDSSKKYSTSADFKCSNSTATFYIGFMEYDIDKRLISPSSVMYISGSLTSLKQDLKNGDTVVYLNDVSGFKVTSSTPYYQRGFIFWNYTDSTGYTYPELTYSRNYYSNLYTYDNIDTTNNTITLTSAWSGGTYVAGTKLSQSSSGADFNYSLLQGSTLSSTWKTYSNTINGIATGGFVDRVKFRYAVKYVRPGFYINYNSTANTTFYMKNFVFKEIK